MQTLDEKRIVIRLPQIRLKSFLTLRFALILGFLLFSCACVYWIRNVYPFLSLKEAHINAYSAVLSSDAPGRIVEIGPLEGDRVKKGAFLFSCDQDLDTSGYAQKKALLAQLLEQIDFEKEQMIQAMEGYVVATNDLEMGAGAPENVQKQLRFLEESQKKSEEAESKAASLRKELDSMGKGGIVAPFDGTILRRHKNEGEICSAAEPIFTLCDLDRLWVEVEVPETQIQNIAIGTPARVRIHAYPKKEFAGKVSYIGSATRAKSEHLPWFEGKTIPIKIALQTKDPILKPGLSAKVDLRVY